MAKAVGKGMSEIMSMHPNLAPAAKGAGKGEAQARAAVDDLKEGIEHLGGAATDTYRDESRRHEINSAAKDIAKDFVQADVAERVKAKAFEKLAIEADNMVKDPRTVDVVKGVGKGVAKAVKGAGKGVMKADAVAKGVGKDLHKLASEADRASMDPRTGDVVKGVGKGVAKVVGKGMSSSDKFLILQRYLRFSSLSAFCRRLQ